MATISAKKLQLALDSLFRDQLQLVGARLRRRGPIFPLHPDSSAVSYFVSRTETRMERNDFERLGPVSPATLAADLARMWEERGSPELVPLAPALAVLAEAAAEIEQESEGDVSPFVYVMY